MPQMKSFSSSPLRDISLKFVATHIHLFQLNAKKLPETVIRDLYEVCYSKAKLHHLPSELFVTASTVRLNGFLKFDLSRGKILNKVCEECKNLRELSFYIDFIPLKLPSEKFSQLFMSIPKIVDLNLASVLNVTDQHLSLIEQHCPLLRNLCLKNCKKITNEGIRFLSNTEIHYLDLSDTNITAEGCVIAIKNLKKLTNLTEYNHWGETIKLLQAEQDSGGKPATSYSIESIFVRRGTHVNNMGETVAKLFPKLKKLFMNDPILHTSFIFLTQKLGKNLTEVNIEDAPFDTIRLIGHFCPLLEDLRLSVDTQIVESYDECLETPCDHVPYQRLRSLELSLDDSYLPRDWLEKLLKNCRLLETLSLNCCDRISDDFAFVMQLGNQFRHLNEICFRCCNAFSLRAVQMLLEFLPVVSDIVIYKCLDSSDRLLLKKYVENNNWDLCLDDDLDDDSDDDSDDDDWMQYLNINLV